MVGFAVVTLGLVIILEPRNYQPGVLNYLVNSSFPVIRQPDSITMSVVANWYSRWWWEYQQLIMMRIGIEVVGYRRCSGSTEVLRASGILPIGFLCNYKLLNNFARGDGCSRQGLILVYLFHESLMAFHRMHQRDKCNQNTDKADDKSNGIAIADGQSLGSVGVAGAHFVASSGHRDHNSSC